MTRERSSPLEVALGVIQVERPQSGDAEIHQRDRMRPG